jgi:hypothetical protein
MARVAGRDHGLRRAAGALGVGPVGIEPEPERDPDRIRQRPEQGDRAVDAAAHRNGNPTRRPRRTEDGPDRIRQRVHRERLTTNSGSLEQGKPDQGALQAGRVGVDNPIAVDRQPNERKLSSTGRISD